MRKLLAIVCVCGCMSSGMAMTATAGEGPSVKLATLVDGLSPAPQKRHSPLLKFAGSCSITCGTARYSHSCTTGQCTCNCSQGCYCAGGGR